MGIEFGPGSLAAALGLAGAGLAILMPDNKWVGVALVVAAIAVLFFDVRFAGGHLEGHMPIKPQRPLALIGMAVFAIGFVGCTIWYFWPSSNIYPAFSAAYTKYQGELGQSISDPIKSAASDDPKDQSSGAGLTWTENAYVIWLRNPQIMIAFQKADAKGRGAATTNDTSHDIRTEPELWDDKYINGKLAKKLRHPPHGSLAYRLIHDSQHWAWIGDTQRQCGIDGSKVFSQDFENGHIYGLFRVSPSNDQTQDSMIFIVLNDGRWFREAGTMDAPRIRGCEDGL